LAALLCVLATAPAQAAFKRAPIELGPSDGESPKGVTRPRRHGSRGCPPFPR
jgi:hypothetical protein